tara:strand:- start:948 stop:1454 length:507 start_codon:yes stop_codon:yes gene_type:complete
MSLKKLQELGIIRLCKCGCGESLRKRNQFIDQNHSGRYYHRLKREEIYRERGYGANERPRKPRTLSARDIAARKFDFENAQKMYRYLLGENMDGGKRLWFIRHDVFWILGEWARISNGISDKFLKVMRGLEQAGLIETRRATEGSQGHKGNSSWLQYRLCKVDLEFLE